MWRKDPRGINPPFGKTHTHVVEEAGLLPAQVQYILVYVYISIHELYKYDHIYYMNAVFSAIGQCCKLHEVLPLTFLPQGSLSMFPTWASHFITPNMKSKTAVGP